MGHLEVAGPAGGIPQSPYTYTGYISGKLLFGREEKLRDIEAYLTGGARHVVVLYGQRRIGKTSVLRHLEQHRRPDGYLPVFFDLAGHSEQPRERVLYELAKEIARATGNPSPPEAPFQVEEDHFRRGFLPGVYASIRDLRLLLLLDEFEAISYEQPDYASTTLFRYLADLFAREPRLGCVLAVGRHLIDTRSQLAYVFREMPSVELPLLEFDGTCDLIVEPARDLVTYDTAAIDRIWELTSGHPLCTQLLCDEVFRSVVSQGRDTVQAEDVDDILEDALEHGQGGLAWIWEKHSAYERVIMSAIASAGENTAGVSRSEVGQILAANQVRVTRAFAGTFSSLTKAQVLSIPSSDHYRFSVELFRMWLAQEHPLDTAKDELDKPQTEATWLLLAAEELHRDKNWAGAESRYEEVLRIQPDNIDAWLALGRLRYERSRHKEAFETFLEALEWEDNAEARRGLYSCTKVLVLALQEYNNVPQLLDVLRRAYSVLPDKDNLRDQLVDTLLAQGSTLRQQKQYAEAQALLIEAVELCGNLGPLAEQRKRAEEELHATRVDVLRAEAVALGMRPQARAKWAALLELEPGDEQAKESLEAIARSQNLETLATEAYDLRAERQWKDAAQTWTNLLEKTRESDPPYYYKGKNVALLLAEAASQLARASTHKPAASRFYQDPDGVLRLGPDDGDGQPGSRSYALTLDTLWSWTVLWAAGGAIFGLVAGAFLAWRLALGWVMVFIGAAIIAYALFSALTRGRRDRIRRLDRLENLRL